MSSTYTSTYSLSLLDLESGGSADDSTVDMRLVDLDLAVSTASGSSGEGTGMALATGGDAFAAGENTLASASVTAGVSSGAASTEAHASATFEAAATSQGDAATYAAATAFANLTGHADRNVSLSYTSSSMSQQDGMTASEATAIVELYALDVHGRASGVEAYSSDLPSAGPDALGEDDDGGSQEWDPDFALDGNVAFFDVFAEASGEDSFVEVDLFAMAVEDQLSNVTVLVTTAVG
jgi:hypothetical protein